MSKAAVRKNQADLLNQQKKDRKDLFAQRRQLVSGTGSVNSGNLATNSGGGAGGGLSFVNIESSPNTNALIKTGDTMEGPLAFKPNNITISGGKLTMSTILLSNPTSWCIATGESSAADDLYYIITQYNGTDVGALFSGQILILQAGVYNITLKHRGTSSSNIYIPSGSDLTLTGYTSGTSTGGEIAILMYDDQVVGGEWILVATSKPLGSGGSWVGTATSTLDMNNFNIEDVNALKINSGSADSSESLSIYGTASTATFKLIDDSDNMDFAVDDEVLFRINDDGVYSYKTPNSDYEVVTKTYLESNSVTNPMTVDLEIDPNKSVKSSSTSGSGYNIGFHCSGNSGAGTAGQMELPYVSNSTNAPSDVVVNGWFGDDNGSIGIQYYTTSGQTRIWIKANTTWQKAYAT